MIESMKVVSVSCCVCESSEAEVVGAGYDFEYHTSPDVFYAHKCGQCGLVYLNPRPDVAEFERIYPPTYHSLDFSQEDYGFIHEVRSRLESKRLLDYCHGAPDDARILDVGCGDGFHLKLLQKNGASNWTLEGVDVDRRAVEVAGRTGLRIYHGALEQLDLEANSYDVVYCIQTIEHVEAPDALFQAVYRILKPGGTFAIVTDNTDSLDFGLFKRRHWGGYHFPRHWNLFNKKSISCLAEATRSYVFRLKTIVSPVNWVFSFHNRLVDNNAPAWLINRFTLKSPLSLAVFTVLDNVFQKLGKGALLNALFAKPAPPTI